MSEKRYCDVCGAELTTDRAMISVYAFPPFEGREVRIDRDLCLAHYAVLMPKLERLLAIRPSPEEMEKAADSLVRESSR